MGAGDWRLKRIYLCTQRNLTLLHWHSPKQGVFGKQLFEHDGHTPHAGGNLLLVTLHIDAYTLSANFVGVVKCKFSNL